MKINIILLFFLFTNFVNAQEICNNGIDDDSDGLVDMLDSDCLCNTTYTSLVTNYSFEQKSSCPTTYKQITRATGWVSGNGEAIDYQNSCGFKRGNMGASNGNGYVGNYYLEDRLRYIAQCLPTPLNNGTNYSFKFDISSLFINNSGSNLDNTVGTLCSFTYNSITYPITVVLYGTSNCSDLPWSGTSDPIGNGSWVELGRVTYSPADTVWTDLIINFTAPSNISAIAFGPPDPQNTNFPVFDQGGTGNIGCFPYVQYDNIILTPTSQLMDIEINQAGGYCLNNLILNAVSTVSGGVWQWYKNGIALSGETSSSLNISSNAYGVGKYTARYLLSGNCFTEDYYLALPNGISTNFSTATSCMENIVAFNDLSFGGSNIITNWNWSFGDGQVSSVKDPVNVYTSNNTYSVKLVITTNQGCKDSVTKSIVVNKATPLNLNSCSCNGFNVSLIPNPSFEDHSCVPTSYSQLNCADTWIQASDATSDYLYEGSFNGVYIDSAYSGVGYAGYIDGGAGYKEYIGACLSEPMTVGETYNLEISIAGTQDAGFSFWGTNTCNDLPFSGSACPQGLGNWQVLNEQTVTLNGGWKTISISITPTQNITAVLIGPSCTSAISGFGYYAVDDLNLSSSLLSPIEVLGTYCSKNMVLKSKSKSSYVDIKYQWFKNGVELIGETDTILNISQNGYGTGDYQIMGIVREGCDVSAILNVDTSYVDFNLSSKGTCPTSTNGSVQVRNVTGLGVVSPFNFYLNGTGPFTDSTFINLSAGSYTIKVTDSNGCYDSATVNVASHPVPLPSFTTIAVCLGKVTTFTNSSSISSGSITTYGWAFGGTSIVPTPTINVQNPTFTYDNCTAINNATLIAISDSGCVGFVVNPVAVNCLPISNFTVANSCQNNLVQFAGTSSNGVGTTGMLAHNWNLGSNNSTLQNPTNTYTVAGTTTVSLTVTDVKGCKDSIAKPITIYALPTASFVSDSVCFSSPSHLLDASNGNGNPLTNYAWDFTNDNLADVIGPNTMNYTMPLLGNNNVNYTVTSTPIAGLTCKTATSSNVYTFPNPVASFSFLNNCVNAQPNTFDANASSTSVGSIANYAWGFGDGQTTNSIMAITPHSYSLATVYNVTLTVTTNKGCAHNVTKQVEVYEKPLTLITSQPNVCLGTASTFTSQTLPNSGTISSWLWDVNNSLNTIETNGEQSNFTFGTTGTQTINLIATTNKGCKDTITRTVYINSIPNPQFVVNDPEGCSLPHCVTFTDQTPIIPAPAKIVSWNWNFGNASTNSSTTSNSQNACYANNSSNQLAQFTVTLTTQTDSGCVASNIKTNLITVYPKPIANYTITPDLGNVVVPQVIFNNQSIDYTKWYWTFGDGSKIDSIHLNPAHTYSTNEASQYYSMLIVANQYGCKDTAQLLVEIAPEFVFYIPNAFSPNGDGLNDGFIGVGIGIEKHEMWVFDRWGSTVYYTDDITKPWYGKVQGKSEEAPQNVYTWKVELKDIFGKKHNYVGHVTLLR